MERMIEQFPAAELARAIKNIDRFDGLGVDDTLKTEQEINTAFKACDEVSKKIIDET